MMIESYQQYLDGLKQKNIYRSLTEVQSPSAEYLDFSSNDYLGLSKHPKVIQAGVQACEAYGMGATGSRLLSGQHIVFERFEALIARDQKTESSLIFSSGFQANLSALSALLNPKVLGTQALVFFDKYNHASLYQAVFLSSAQLIRYHHNDMEHLKALLERYQEDPRPKFIVTETLFGMDGDFLRLDSIALLAEKYRTFLYLDEAHATGILGQGYGLSTEVNLGQIPHAIMGTFSKALGCSGAYLGCSHVLREYLINSAQGFIYSTAPPPGCIGAAMQAWTMIPSLSHEREYLQDLGRILRDKLRLKGWDTAQSETHIIPIILKKEERVIQAQAQLKSKGILVSAIRPPTVPPNASRLRIALSAQHQEKDLEQLVQNID